MPTASWARVLDDDRPVPPAWRVCHSLVGIPDALPASEWAAMLAAAAAAYGPAVVARGLRLAAGQPPMTGWTAAQRRRAAALATAWEAAA